MATPLEQNIDELNDYLARENTLLVRNQILHRKISNLEAEIGRSQISFDRISLVLFYLTLIALGLFLYASEIDIMYPLRLFSDFLSGMVTRQLTLVVVMSIIIFSVLYFTKASFMKAATSLTVTALILFLLQRFFGLQIGLISFLIFLIVYFYLDM